MWRDSRSAEESCDLTARTGMPTWQLCGGEQRPLQAGHWPSVSTVVATCPSAWQLRDVWE